LSPTQDPTSPLTQDPTPVPTLAPILPVGSISGVFFNDVNGDGTMDTATGDAGVDNIQVSLIDSCGSSIAVTTTGFGGLYQFASLAPGAYSVMFSDPSMVVFNKIFVDLGPPVPGFADPVSGGSLISNIIVTGGSESQNNNGAVTNNSSGCFQTVTGQVLAGGTATVDIDINTAATRIFLDTCIDTDFNTSIEAFNSGGDSLGQNDSGCSNGVQSALTLPGSVGTIASVVIINNDATNGSYTFRVRCSFAG